MAVQVCVCVRARTCPSVRRVRVLAAAHIPAMHCWLFPGTPEPLPKQRTISTPGPAGVLVMHA